MALDINRAFTRPTNDPKLSTKLAIGTIVGIIPIIQVINSGYMLTDLKNLLEGRGEELPDWKEINLILTRTVMAFIINFLYMIVPLGLLLASLFPLIIGMVQGSGLGAATGGIMSLVLGLAGAILLVAAAVMLPVALALYAKTENLGSAFNFSEIFSIITNNISDFVKYVLIMFGLGIAVFGIFFMLGFALGLTIGAFMPKNLFDIFFGVLGSLAGFYLMLIANCLIAQIIGIKQKEIDPAYYS